MEISPLLLCLLLLHAFLFGCFLGVVNDGNRIVRVFFGVQYSERSFRSLYARNLPLIHRPLQRKDHGKRCRGVLSVLIFVQDLLLCTVGGIGVALLQYEYNSGRFRFFILPAILAGFLLYYFTVGKWMMLVSEGVVFVLRASFLIIGRCVLYPFVKIFQFFVKKLKKISKKIRFLIAKRTKKLYNIHKKSEWLHWAQSGGILFDR